MNTLLLPRYNTYKSWWFTGLLHVALIILLSLAIFEQPTIAKFQSLADQQFWVTVGACTIHSAFYISLMTDCKHLYNIQFYRVTSSLSLKWKDSVKWK